MGYYTTYRLTLESDPSNQKEEINELITKGHEDYFCYGIMEGIDEDNEAAKWYDSDTDMMRLSKKYPEVVFLLEAKGEDSGDLWQEYWKNGSYQRCNAIITYDKFDESKLTLLNK